MFTKDCPEKYIYNPEFALNYSDVLQIIRNSNLVNAHIELEQIDDKIVLNYQDNGLSKETWQLVFEQTDQGFILKKFEGKEAYARIINCISR